MELLLAKSILIMSKALFASRVFKMVFFKLFKSVLVSNNKNPRGYLQYIKRQYFLSIIDVINPVILFTYIDNDPYFHKICKLRPRIIGIGVQNGARTHYNYNDKVIEKYNIPYYFVHGEHAKSTYIDNGHQYKKIFVVGSIKLDHYMMHQKNKNKNKYQLCLISSWVTGDNTNGDYPFSKKNQYKSLLQIQEVVKRKKYSLVVALKTTSKNENIFYKNIFGSYAHYHYGDSGSYDVCMKSKTILSTYSTLGFEMLSIGKNVIFFNLSGDDRYTHTLPNTITTTDNNNLIDLIDNSINGDFYYKYKTSTDTQCIFNKTPSFEVIKSFIDKKI